MFPQHIPFDLLSPNPDSLRPWPQYFTDEQIELVDRTCAQQVVSLDGANDSLIDNPYTRSKLGSKKYMKQSCLPDAKDKPQAPQSASLTTDNDNSNVITDEDSVDDRRKRRKISGSKSHNNQQTLLTANNNNSVGERVGSGNGQSLLSLQRNPLLDIHRAVLSTQQKLQNVPVVIGQEPETQVGEEEKSNGEGNLMDTTETPATDSTLATSRAKTKRPYTKRKKPPLSANATSAVQVTGGLCSSQNDDGAKDIKRKSGRTFTMKNGKFVQTMKIILRYGNDNTTQKEIGARIETIMAKSGQNPSILTERKDLVSKPHPFFSVKPRSQLNSLQPVPDAGENTNTEDELKIQKQEPIAWKDLKFSKLRPAETKSLGALRPLWPPLPFHHVGNTLPSMSQPPAQMFEPNRAKLKANAVRLEERDSVLAEFKQALFVSQSLVQGVQIPERLSLSGRALDRELIRTISPSGPHTAVVPLRVHLVEGSCAFDRGECAGPNLWTVQYSPSTWTEIMQPSASTLFRWLQGLAIHDVKSGIDSQTASRKQRRPLKKKRRPPKDELDDFIVKSEDEEDSQKDGKSAILITGPNGCGKTASIFAVAKELGFEVFEIHPGMRRSAKDIFDKVGDMAHNHLVQQSNDLSRPPSATSSGPLVAGEGANMDRQSRLATPQGASLVKAIPVGNSLPHRTKKEQKQSLILFEEADILFEEDKGFWGAVQSLISHSRRPIVLTCNDISSVPINDLDLYDILDFTSIEEALAVDYLTYVSSAEGHIIDREALSTLYKSKKNDLRASVTELNMWCQMTVGSQKGGLDWMAPHQETKLDDKGDTKRIFSKGTFTKALDLFPQPVSDPARDLEFVQENLGIPASEWCDIANPLVVSSLRSLTSRIQMVEQLENIADARSLIDILDDHVGPAVCSATAHTYGYFASEFNRHTIAAKLTQDPTHGCLTKWNIVQAFDSITREKPTFPPAQGRLAPSLDATLSSAITDIAPYVRYIVNCDMRLEEQHNAIFGSQAKARKTRAARAAAEGGDKASTRNERWFPKDLDFDLVLATGGSWPMRFAESEEGTVDVDHASPSTSSDI